MKKYILSLIAIVTFTFVSCEKNEVTESTNQDAIEAIKSNAVKISNSHDSLILEMLNVEKQKIRQKIKSSNGTTTELNMNEVLYVIEEVTGIRPIILSNSISAKRMTKSTSENDNMAIDFDVDNLSLSEYANSEILKKYLNSIDKISQDSTITTANKHNLINVTQDEILQDPIATLTDKEIFFNLTEILKGSLSLWNNELSNNKNKQNVSGLYLTKPSNWGFFKKVGFVAAADALGAILGTFLGGVVVINGVPMYVPAGPSGTAVGAAMLSFIAVKMVGW